MATREIDLTLLGGVPVTLRVTINQVVRNNVGHAAVTVAGDGGDPPILDDLAAVIGDRVEAHLAALTGRDRAAFFHSIRDALVRRARRRQRKGFALSPHCK